MLLRIFVGLVAVPAVVWVCRHPMEQWLIILVGIALVLGWREAIGLLGRRVRLYPWLGLIAGIGMVFGGWMRIPLVSLAAFTCGIMAVWLVGMVEARANQLGEGNGAFGQVVGVAVTGWLVAYIFGGGLHLIWLRQFPGYGRELMWWLVCMVWTADSAAYFFGSWFGRRRIFGAVSPAKSLEGLFAALTVPLMVIWMLRTWTPWFELPVGFLVAASFLVSLLAQCGDVAESLLKRFGGTKDSWALIPGHGGMLDKLDSFLFAGPALYYYSRWFFS